MAHNQFRSNNITKPFARYCVYIFCTSPPSFPNVPATRRSLLHGTQPYRATHRGSQPPVRRPVTQCFSRFDDWPIFIHNLFGVLSTAGLLLRLGKLPPLRYHPGVWTLQSCNLFLASVSFEHQTSSLATIRHFVSRPQPDTPFRFLKPLFACYRVYFGTLQRLSSSTWC